MPNDDENKLPGRRETRKKPWWEGGKDPLDFPHVGKSDKKPNKDKDGDKPTR